MNSPSHRANIINPDYTEIGTAVLDGFGQNNTIVVVQEFGTQLLGGKVAVQSKTNSAVKTDEPVPITNTQASTANGKVLSQITEPQNYIEFPTSTGVNNLSSKLLNFVLYNYDGLLQNIIYGTSLIVMGILLALIFFSFNINFRKELVFRAVLVVVLLSAATLLNKEMIISLIPHKVII